MLLINLECSFELLHPVLEGLLVVLEGFDLLALSLTRVVGCETVTLDTLDAALLLLVVCLGPFPRWEVRLWLWKDLAPGLPLLRRLAVGVCGRWCWRRGVHGSAGCVRVPHVVGRRRHGKVWLLEVLHLDGGGLGSRSECGSGRLVGEVGGHESGRSERRGFHGAVICIWKKETRG